VIFSLKAQINQCIINPITDVISFKLINLL